MYFKLCRIITTIICSVFLLMGCSDQENADSSISSDYESYASLSSENEESLGSSEFDEILKKTDSIIGSKQISELKKRKRSFSNPLTGIWVGPCKYLGGNEYIQEKLIVPRDRKKYLYRQYFNSKNATCSNPWMKITHKLKYKILDESFLTTEGSKIDFLLLGTWMVSYDKMFTLALNRHCMKKGFIKFRTNRIKRVNKMSCGDYIKFPKSRITIFDIILLEEGKITLGNKIEELNPSERPTNFSNYSFIKS